MWSSPHCHSLLPQDADLPILRDSHSIPFHSPYTSHRPYSHLPRLADDLTPDFTANRCHHTIVTFPHQCYKTPCTCALCLFSCSHGCSVLTPIKGRSHHDLWVPSLPLVKDFCPLRIISLCIIDWPPNMLSYRSFKSKNDKQYLS